MEQNKPSGAGFLKVVGILMIVFGGISIIISGISAAASIAVSALLSGTEDGGLTGLLNMLTIVAFVASALQLVTGILGVAFSKKPEKAMVCMIFGIIVLLLGIISAVVLPMIVSSNEVYVALVGEMPINWVSLFTGAIMPVLFIIGAAKNKA